MWAFVAEVRPPEALEPDGASLLEIAAGFLKKRALVQVRLVDVEQQPLPGVELRLTNAVHGDHFEEVVASGVSDEDGVVVLRDVPFGNYLTEFSDDFDIAAGTGHPGGSYFRPWLYWTLTLEKLCPGDYQVVDAGGDPVPGSLLQEHHGFTVRTDEEGRYFAPKRRCGFQELAPGPPEGPLFPEQRVFVEGDEVARLTLGELTWGEAEVRILGPDGQPIGVEATTHGHTQMEALGPGSYRVSAPTPTASITVRGEGAAVTSVRLPMDGGVHLAWMKALRPVEVSVTCSSGCPEQLYCGKQLCEGSRTHALCPCPEGDTHIYADIDTRRFRGIGAVPASADEVSFDLRVVGDITGRWTGPLPCGASTGLLSSRGRSADCSPSGAFRLQGLQEGPHDVRVYSGDQEYRTIVQMSGGDVDLGKVGPQEPPVMTVRLVADFPLEGTTLSAIPGHPRKLSEDHFEVDLPEGAETVSLMLLVWGRGGFNREVAIGDGLTWRLSAEDNLNSVPLESAPQVQESAEGWDTGGADTGLYLEDTGDTAALGFDSGYWETGDWSSSGDTDTGLWSPFWAD